MRVRFLISLFICIFCLFGAAWAGYHLWYLANGNSPLEIAEPNVWLARGEFLFAVLIALLGLGGFLYTIVRLRQGRCPLCCSDLNVHLPIRRRETANSTDKTPPIRPVHTANIAVAGTGKGAAHGQEN